MKLFKWCKGGGPESNVDGFFLVEIKGWFSVAVLRFGDGSREAYHSHAFNCWNWLLKGRLRESILYRYGGSNDNLCFGFMEYLPSFKPFFIGRRRFHKVASKETSWVLSFRGPWKDTWEEYLPKERKFVTLTHGRETVT